MVKKMALLFFLFFSFLFIYVVNHALSYSYPNIYIARLNVGNKSTNTVTKLINQYANQEIRIKVKDHVYQFTYSALGIVLDKKTTLHTVFEPNNKPFPHNIFEYLSSTKSQKLIFPTLIFTQDFYRFVDNTIFNIGNIGDELLVDNTIKHLEYKPNEEEYRISKDQLQRSIALSFGSEQTMIEPPLIPVSHEVTKSQVEDINQRLEQTFQQPIDLVMQEENAFTKITLLPQDVKPLVDVVSHYAETIRFAINDTAFGNLMQLKIAPVLGADRKCNQEDLKKSIVSIIESRFQGFQTGAVLAKVQIKPNTSGEKAKKYIEIDISQQTMYLFQDGVLAGTHKISSGLYYPTPRGEFKILNKAFNAYSDIYNVWMPYWMGFYYSLKLNAYFGIHELPYWVSGDGLKIQRPREFIGSPHTGGCVSLDIGAAREVYDFSEVGMLVYVFD